MERDTEFIRRIKKMLRDVNVVLFYKIQDLKEDMKCDEAYLNSMFLQYYLTNYQNLQQLLG
jgi:hypothetical protein